jgi:hypothetical protein
MSTMGGVPRRGFIDLVSAVIEEAWRRARRRRLMYAGIVLSLAVIGAVVTATLRGGPSSSSSTPAAVASPSTPVTGVAVSARKARHHHYHLYPGDVVDVDGSPRFAWSCSYYWVGGPQVRSYRLFRCARTDSGQPGAGDRLRLNVVVSRDNVFLQRGHKTVYADWR